MKSDKATVTLYAANTAEDLARACRDFAENGWPRCPVGFWFHCPLGTRCERCEEIEASDWEAVMTEVGVAEDV